MNVTALPVLPALIIVAATTAGSFGSALLTTMFLPE